MNKPLSEMTIEELMSEAVSASHAVNHEWNHNRFDASDAAVREGEAIFAEARRRDAVSTAWPQGDVAAEQLARAWRETWMYDKSLPLEQHAAAVLAALAAQDAGAQEADHEQLD